MVPASAPAPRTRFPPPPPPPALASPRPPRRCARNYHRDSEAAIHRPIDLELSASCVYLSMSYYFDQDDVALRNLAKCFLYRSQEEREPAEKLMNEHCLNEQVNPIEELGDPRNQLAQVGGPCTAEHLFDKHTLGGRGQS